MACHSSLDQSSNVKSWEQRHAANRSAGDRDKQVPAGRPANRAKSVSSGFNEGPCLKS